MTNRNVPLRGIADSTKRESAPPACGTSLCMGRWTLLTAILAITSFLISAQGEESPRPVIAPAYRIDLRNIVKGPFAFIRVGPAGESRVGLPIRSVRFLDNQRLAATVVTQAPGTPALPERGQPTAASRFRLHMVLFEAETGKILATPTWPSNTRYAWIAAVNDLGFVIAAGTDLTLFSPGLEPVKGLVVPQPPTDRYAHDLFWIPIQSWSGKRVLLHAAPAWSLGLCLWLDAENLRVIKSWRDVVGGSLAASDDQLVMEVPQRHRDEPPPFLEISSPGGPWKRLPATINASSWQFVDQGLLYLQSDGTGDSRVPGGVFLMRTDTGELSRLEPPREKNWGLGQAAVSRAGTRFVILVEQTKGAHRALDISGHDVLRALLVFDPPFTTPSFTLEVRGSRIKNPNITALSPDGRHLAVFAYPDPVIEVYDLPPPK
jgi:hypothetical protein